MSEMAGIFGDENLQCLTFKVAEGEFSVDIMSVREIKGWTSCTRLPGSPGYMRGVMNLRGAIIPIFDLRSRFNQGLTEASPKHVVVILATQERNMGLLVDAVSDIITLPRTSMKDAPKDGAADVDERFVSGLIDHDNRMIIHLNIDNLFHEDSPMPALSSDINNANLIHAQGA